MTIKNTNIIQKNTVFLWLALTTGSILLIPLLVMQFSGEVQWGPEDFTIIGGLLFGMGSVLVVLARKVRSTTHQVMLAVGCIALVLYLWAELAVGIFTNWGS